jgi:hypothetical protein
MATITPAATLHAAINVPVNVTDLVDAAWMALYTWKQLADNAKYALDQIDIKIAAMKADNALTFTGNLVTFTKEVAVEGNLQVLSISAASGTVNVASGIALVGDVTLTGGRRVDRVRTIDTWGAEPYEVYHTITAGNVIRCVTSVTALLRLLATSCVEGDWVRVTLTEGASVAIYNGEAAYPIVTLSNEGQQITLVYTTADGWGF